MERPSFSEIYMKLAWLMATRSTCSRLNVGCVITTEDYRQVLSVGYNGNAAGLPNRCDSTEPGACGCIHSEENAIIKCYAPPSVKKIVFCTHQPCKMCAKRLVNLGGVSRVLYDEPYRLRDGLHVLGDANILYAQVVVDLPEKTKLKAKST